MVRSQVSEMEIRYISLSIFLTMQHPSILSTLYMLFLILSSWKKSAPFHLGDGHSQISWSLFSRNTILWCEISPCNLFLCPFFTTSNTLSSFLVFAGCHLVLSPLVCALCQFISCHMKKKWERSDNNRDKGKVEGVDHRITLYNFPFII